MRILVEVGCEIDPMLNVRIDRASGKAIAEAGDTLLRVRPLGRLGIDMALQVPGAEVTAFALGRGHEAALKHALAAGAARAVTLWTGSDDPTPISVEALAEWLARQDPKLVIGDRTVAKVAGQLDWAHAAGVETVCLEANEWIAVRSLGRGDRERVRLALPAVIRLDPARRPRYLARARWAACERREIPEILLAQARSPLEAGPLQTARARTRLGNTPAPAGSATTASGRLQALMGMSSAKRPQVPQRPVLDEAGATPEAMAESFVRYLAHHGLLETR